MTIYQTWGSVKVHGGSITDARKSAYADLLKNTRREHGVQEIAPDANGTNQWVRYAGPRDDIHDLLQAEPERVTYHSWKHGGQSNLQAVYTWEEA